MRTLKTFFIFFIILGSYTVQAQYLVGTYRTHPIISTTVGKDADAIVGALDVQNTASESVTLSLIKEMIEVEGSASIPVSNVRIVKDGITVASGQFYGNSMQDFFRMQGGTYMFFWQSPIIMAPGETITLSIVIHTTADAQGRFRFITSELTGQTPSVQIVSLEKPVYHEWYEIDGYIPSSASISFPQERIVAPGTKNFSLTMSAQSPDPVQGMDIIMNYPGISPLVYAVGPFMQDAYQPAGWETDGNTVMNATRIIAYGLTPQNYIGMGSQYFRLSDAATTGDTIPLAFSMAAMNDSIYPSFNNCRIIIGPQVIFGDANGDSSVTVMDLVTMLKYLTIFPPADTGVYLKTRLASDLDGSGWIDSYDLYLERQMLLQPYFVPPVADPYYFGPGSNGIKGRMAKTTVQPTLTLTQTADGIEVRASIPITNADLYISGAQHVINGSMQSFGSTLRGGKTYTFLASDSAVSDKPLCIIQSASMENLTVTGFFNNHVPFTVTTTVTGVEKESETPKSFSLSQNYPNPFNPTTQITYTIPKNEIVTLKIYNILGQEVATLINNEEKSAGTYTATFNGSSLASGTYLYRLQAGNFISTKKMILMK